MKGRWLQSYLRSPCIETLPATCTDVRATLEGFSWTPECRSGPATPLSHLSTVVSQGSKATHPSAHSFSEHLLSAHCVPGTVRTLKTPREVAQRAGIGRALAAGSRGLTADCAPDSAGAAPMSPSDHSALSSPRAWGRLHQGRDSSFCITCRPGLNYLGSKFNQPMAVNLLCKVNAAKRQQTSVPFVKGLVRAAVSVYTRFPSRSRAALLH